MGIQSARIPTILLFEERLCHPAVLLVDKANDAR
jgi:hypothetical protein